jgi:hydrogenase expression/formation protein HypE
MSSDSKNVVTMAHGSGGLAMQQLIEQLFLQAFANQALDEREDQARLSLAEMTALGDRLAFSTDSYVIDPIFFPGGNIGKLAVCGTVNDVAVSGAVPKYLSCGFILEAFVKTNARTASRAVGQAPSAPQSAGIVLGVHASNRYLYRL